MICQLPTHSTDYSVDTSVSDIIEGSLDRLYRKNVIRVSNELSNADIAKRVNAHHGTDWSTQKGYNRVLGALRHPARNSGKTLEEARGELEETRKANGLRRSSRRRRVIGMTLNDVVEETSESAKALVLESWLFLLQVCLEKRLRKDRDWEFWKKVNFDFTQLC